jgi:hypothetical protein
MHVPLWAMKLAPYVGGALLLGGAALWLINYGRDTEREKWQAREAAAVLKMRERENAMQAQVDAAGAALSEMQVKYDQIRRDMRQIRKVYYVQNPAAAAAVCLSDSRFLHHQRADEAANNPAPAR